MGRLMGASGIKSWLRQRAGGAGDPPNTETPTIARGAAAEDRALAHLLLQGLTLIERNYRVARGPSARAGEVDLIMRAADGTLVFVEVRSRRDARHGGAAASVSARKRASLVLAARHYLLRFRAPPPCRFDLVAIEGDALTWLPAAFDAS